MAFSVAIGILFMFQVHTLNFKSVLVSKVLGFLGAVLLYGYTSGKTYFYFRNAGISINRLIINAFVIDATIFTIVTLLWPH